MYISGGIVCKDNPLYLEASSNFNLALKKCPCIVVFCFCEDDIISTLKYALSKDIPFRIRSGRHDYEANSNINKGIVIDISNINYTIIDENNNTAKLGGGIANGKMYSDLIDRGYTIPSGTCKDVGFCGSSTSGGVGFCSRLLGLACDNLLEIEMINYKGEKIVANECFNSDLFWAVRGGLASNFGVVLSLTYKITPVCKVSTYIISWDYKYFTDVLDFWQRFTPFIDVRLTTSVTVQKEYSGDISLLSRGQFFGDPKELERLIEPLIKIVPTKFVEIEYVPYEVALEKWSSPCPSPRKFKGTGSFIYTPLSEYVLDSLKSKLLNAPENSLQFYEFIGLSGNVTNIMSNETAFFHRDSLYLIEVISEWKSNIYEQDNINWTNRVKYLLDKSGIGTYRGFTDFNIVNWQNQYYGDNYSMLMNVKRKYDPFNIFNFNQSIEPY